MTLDEAIIHLEETLNDSNHEFSCEECREQHVQLLGWLNDLRDVQKYSPQTIPDVKRLKAILRQRAAGIADGT